VLYNLLKKLYDSHICYEKSKIYAIAYTGGLRTLTKKGHPAWDRMAFVISQTFLLFYNFYRYPLPILGTSTKPTQFFSDTDTIGEEINTQPIQLNYKYS
jgi:hypothetical protein